MGEPRTLADFGELTPAEQKVLDELDSGEVTILCDGLLPDAAAGPERLLRPPFLRWCILGADENHRVHERGIRILGALIANNQAARLMRWKPHLDLEGCSIKHDLALIECRFAVAALIQGALLPNLFLNRSALPGLSADRLRTRGNVSFEDVESAGTVRLAGAEIGGYLDCVGARLSNPGGTALCADGAKVAGVFYLRRKVLIEGELDLTAAEFGSINDDPACWPAPGDLLLHRCRYGAFIGDGVDATARINWLRLQSPERYGAGFLPQPWEQCAKVLRETGHADAARAILIEKERLQRDDRRKSLPMAQRCWDAFWDRAFDWTIRFGHRSRRAFFWLFLLWAVGVVIFLGAWRADAMKPNNAYVLRAPEWVGCAPNAAPGVARDAPGGASQLDCFLRQPEGQGFPEFNALVYSADVLFPLVEIEQQANWTPDEDMTAGLIAKIVMYLNIIFGWALSLLAVAGFSGLVKSD